MGKKIRLDKYLTEMNIGSRSQVKEAAKKGRIRVNGVTETKTDRKVDAETDEITFDGRLIRYQAFVYYMLHKPQGVVTATEDKKHRTVLDLIPDKERKDMFPVGRLDRDTEGLLLITNDGELAHNLLSPKKHVPKQYLVQVDEPFPDTAPRTVSGGMILKDGTKLQPAKLVFTDEERKEALLTINEGKFHQIKRMTEVFGCHVTYLKRLSMGSLRLDETLACGSVRPLTFTELMALYQDAGFQDKRI